MSERPSDNSTGDQTGSDAGATAGGLVDVVLYGVARLLLAVVLTGVIYVAAWLLGIKQFPIFIAALFALVTAMPLGILVFGKLRHRATAAMAVTGERRRREREQLQARLRGEPATDDGPDEEPDEDTDAAPDAESRA